MEKEEFDTDLDDDDDDDDDDQKSDLMKFNSLPRLSFDNQILAHRSNRSHQTFGQLNVPLSKIDLIKSIDDEILVPFRRLTTVRNDVVEIYEKCCHLLDIPVDWQLKAVLIEDHIAIIDRSLSFNEIRAFSTGIQSNLESLTLQSVGLTSRAMHVLCQGLTKCVRLTFLDLSYNKFGKKGLEYLVANLKNLPSLLYLSLAECGIRDAYGRSIGDLCRHKNIKEINLSGNEFEEMSCIFIGHALTSNQSLTYLNISWNLIRSFASIAIFRSFEVNQTLTDFDLSWSGLSYDGSVALRRILIKNHHLTRLNFSNCGIDFSSATLIAQGLEKNTTLTTLNLAFNPLTTQGVQLIVQALTHPKSSLTLLDLSGITVFTSTVTLANRISARRNFVMKFDFETSVHDKVTRKRTTKNDSMRKIIQHIDERHWRTLDYFRMLQNFSKPSIKIPITEHHVLNPHMNNQHETGIEKMHRKLAARLVQPLTFKNLNEMIIRQRLRDRSLKLREQEQKKDVQKRNKKILDTVNQHFPEIDIVSRWKKHLDAIEQLAKPRDYSAKKSF